MRTGIIICCLMTLVIASCNGIFRRETNVLSPERMAYMLNEMALAEGFAESYLFRDTMQSKDSILQKEIDKVLAVNKISATQFSRSYRYYKTKPDLFKEIVDSANALSTRNRDLIYTRRKVKSL